MNQGNTTTRKFFGACQGLWRGIKSSMWPYQAFVFMLFALLGASIYAIALNTTDSHQYITINGSFQTYNPVRRLFLGQVPFRDYVCYLGLGPTYLVFLATLGDPTFYGTVFAVQCLTATCLVLMCMSSGAFAGLSRAINLLFCIVAMSLVFSTAGLAAFLKEAREPLSQLFWPGNSILGLRAVWPFLSATIMFGIGWHRRRQLNQRPYAAAMMSGFLGGAGIGWSNDYGVASLLAMWIVYQLYTLPTAAAKVRHCITTSALFGLTAIVGTVVTIASLTAGHFSRWFSYNMVNVASEQGWYFLGSKVLIPGDFPWNWYLVCSIACFFVMCAMVWRATNSVVRFRLSLLLYILTATLLAGSISILVGHNDPRYYAASKLVTPYCMIAVGMWAARVARERGFSFFPLTNVRWTELVFCAGVLAACFTNVRVLAQKVYDAGAAHKSAMTSANVIRSDELGGRLSLGYSQVITWGRRVASELQGVPADRRILSTYSSGMDVVSGALQPTGYDYVIHALGPDSRRNYMARAEAAAPPYATTVRADFTPWEPWIRRVNWPVYRYIYENYVPVDRTNQTIIWRKIEGGIASGGNKLSCAVSPVDHASADLLITPTNEDSDRPSAEHAVDFVELEVVYSSAWQPHRIFRGGLRKVVSIGDLETARPGLGSGAPPSGTYRLGLELLRNRRARVRITADPKPLSTLEVASCTASIIADRARVDDFPPAQLQASSFTDVNWKQGIGCHHSIRDQFLVSDVLDAQKIKPGTRLRFAGSGWLTVTEVELDRIKVSAPLNSETDGYPNPVIVEQS